MAMIRFGKRCLAGSNGVYETMNHEDPPFEKHRRYYLVIKISAILVAALLALRYLG